MNVKDIMLTQAEWAALASCVDTAAEAGNTEDREGPEPWPGWGRQMKAAERALTKARGWVR